MNEYILPMSESAHRAGEIFTLSMTLGIFLGALYDLLRAARRGLKWGRAAENVTDFFYSLLFFFCLFLLCIAEIGRVRLFPFAAMLLGAVTERFTLGRGIVFVFSRVFELVSALWERTAGRLCVKIRQKIHTRFVRINLKSKKSRKTSRKLLKPGG